MTTNTPDALQTLHALTRKLESNPEMTLDELDQIILEASQSYTVAKNRLDETRALLNKLRDS